MVASGRSVPRKVSFMARVEDVEDAVSFDHAAGAHELVLGVISTTREHLTQIFEVDKVACGKVEPRRSRPMPGTSL